MKIIQLNQLYKEKSELLDMDCFLLGRTSFNLKAINTFERHLLAELNIYTYTRLLTNHHVKNCVKKKHCLSVIQCYADIRRAVFC